VRDAYITRCGTASVWGHAVKISQSSDNLIERNQMVDIGDERANSGDSIYVVSGAHRNRILNNTVQDAGHSLIEMGSQQSTAMSNDNVIADNTLSKLLRDRDHPGVWDARTLIEYNRISDAGRNGVNFARPGIQMQANETSSGTTKSSTTQREASTSPPTSFNGTVPQDSIGNQIYHNVFYNNNRIQDRSEQ